MFEYDIWMPYAFFVYTRLECVDELLPLELHCVAHFLAVGQWIGLDCGEPMVQVVEQHCKCGTIVGEILKCFFPMQVCCVVLVWWQKGPPDESIGIIDRSICNRRRSIFVSFLTLCLGGPGGLPPASCDPCQRNGWAPCHRHGSKAHVWWVSVWCVC